MTLTPAEQRISHIENVFEAAYDNENKAFIKAYQAVAVYALKADPKLHPDLCSDDLNKFLTETLNWSDIDSICISGALAEVFTKIAAAENGNSYTDEQLPQAMIDTVQALRRQSEQRRLA